MGSKYITFCALCGHALMREEICMIINGTYINYRGVLHGDIEIIFCHECWSKIKETLDKGIDPAIKKRTEMENHDRWDVKQVPQFTKYGDDDEAAPVI